MSKENYILGIDEAGRGCVIGPMVICGVLIEEKDITKLKEIGVKDSKLLKPSKREKLAKEIKKIAKKIVIKKISPKIIDKYNLNFLELKEIKKIIEKTKPTIVYFDCPVNQKGIKDYCKKLESLLEKKNVLPKIIGENKADKKYEVVSAASIIAKVERDRIIKNLRKKYGDFGSGYPSDRKTKEFLKNFYNNCRLIIRKKWQIKIN
ncbi:MAG: ribonuclease HII [candidate division WOR-3 bacterium]|nr:ribonuclease HII [candidate division WOR-3 bacterium]